jgi:hypothetical protein
MDNKKRYNQDGYHKGFVDGRRTGGKIKKAYIENFLKDETRNLSHDESFEFMKGWQDGFTDGVRGLINKMMNKKDLLKKFQHDSD